VVDRAQVRIGTALDGLRERRFVGRDDLRLQRERFPLASLAVPVEGLPLQLHPHQTVELELIVDDVEPRTCVADAAVRRHAKLCLGRDGLLLPDHAVARAGKLVVLGPRPRVQRRPGLRDAVAKIGQLEVRAFRNRPRRQRREPSQSRGTVDAEFGLVPPALQERASTVAASRRAQRRRSRGPWFRAGGFQVGDRRSQRAGPLLQQGGVKKRVHLLRSPNSATRTRDCDSAS
jgi:hypothetical protein